MKLLIAFAALLSSALLTVPTVTAAAEARATDAGQMAALATVGAENAG